jgi:hypothetical protein
VFHISMKTIKEILKIYKHENFMKARKLKFQSTDYDSVYNITAPFKFEENLYLLGREEPIEKEGFEAKISLFKKKKTGVWELDKNFKKLNLEDPFISKIGNTFILGGIEVQNNAGRKETNYRTIFYKGENIFNLRKFTTGPWGMKDIRLVEINENKIGVFTRPQGKKGARGKIGFTIISSLDELTPRKLSNAPIIKGQFAKGEWGGVNQALILKNGKVGVLGHIARYSKDKKNRFYYAIVFCFDSETRTASSLRLILRRAELPEGESKNPGLYNVIFPGGIIRKNDGTCLLYAGVGDIEAYKILIKDPFEYYEKNL